MGYMAKFLFGDYEYPLDGSLGFYLSPEFRPPGTIIAGEVIGGIGYNQSRLAEANAQPTTWTLPLYFKPTTGSNQRAEEAVHGLINFLNQIGDEINPVYFAWKAGSSITYEPTWGQFGVYWRAEVIHVESVDWGDFYPALLRTGLVADVYITLRLQPFVFGKRQKLGGGTGTLIMDNLGALDKRSRGLVVQQGLSNKFTNPVFGHATYNDDWTAGSDVLVQRNTDQRFLCYGDSSARLQRMNSTNTTFTQSINVGSTAGHIMVFFAKKRDESAVSSTDMVAYYNGSDLTTYFIPWRDGWYYCWATLTGVNSAVTAGVNLKVNGVEVFIDALYLAASAVPAIPAYGDMLDAVWSGTDHESTSTITSAQMKLHNDALNGVAGTVMIVWRPLAGSTNAYYTSGNVRPFFYDSGTGNFRFVWNTGNGYVTFAANATDVVNSSAVTWTGGDHIVFHVVWSVSGGMKIYKNGVEIGTRSTFTPFTFANTFSIGYDGTDDWINGVFEAFDVYNRAMTATEVLNQYTEIAALVGAGERVDPPAVLWSDDYDSVVDGLLDADQENFVVALNIPGNAPAATELDVTSTQTVYGTLFSLVDTDEYLNPRLLQTDYNGSAFTDAASGEIASTTITTSDATGLDHDVTAQLLKQLGNRTMYPIIRAATASAITDGVLRAQYRGIYADSIYVNFETTLRLYVLAPFQILSQPREGIESAAILGGLTLFRTRSGASVNFYTDIIGLLAKPLLHVQYMLSGTTSMRFVYNSRTRAAYDYRLGATIGYQLGIDTKLELIPEKHNLLISYLGYETDNSAVSQGSVTLTYNGVYVMPKWRLA